MIPIIISGGSGTRLWPVSRKNYPKQFCPLLAQSLQTLSLQRGRKLGKPWVLTNQSLKTLTEINLKEAGLDFQQVIYEPFGKNTAPAIALLCRYFELNNMKDGIVGVFPSDHLIKKEEQFFKAVRHAEELAIQGYVVTLGVKPHYPETGYGYIETQNQVLRTIEGFSSYPVQKFHEKPDFVTAKKFLEQGNYSWNAGIFIFKIDTMISHFQKFCPQLWGEMSHLEASLKTLAEIYSRLESKSIDYAIMENLSAKELACIPCDMGWSDVGSWDAIAEEYESMGTKNKDVLDVDAKNNFVLGLNHKTVALVGVDDLIVVDTPDALLVSKKGSSQQVKRVVDQLVKKKDKIAEDHLFEERPWGRFEVLRDSAQFRSKVITVLPNSQISYQSHTRREEHWIIVSGKGEVVLNDKTTVVEKGQYIHIPLGSKHRIRNTQSEVLQFIEVQLGSYFGEDDIVRYQDDYKRV